MANPMMIERDGKTFYPVSTTNGVEVPEGCIMLTANVRETKGNPCPADRKHRNVVIPEYQLPESVDKRFQSVLLDTFYRLAKEYLESRMEESDRMIRELPTEDFSIDNLLSFFGRVAVSQRLTKESVIAWFNDSATCKKIMEKKPESVGKYRDLFAKTASPNHGINPNTCKVLLATMKPSDAESKVGESLAERWQATVTKSLESEVEAL